MHGGNDSDLSGSRHVPGRRHMQSEHWRVHIPVASGQQFVQRRGRLHAERLLSERDLQGRGTLDVCRHPLPRGRNLFGWELFTRRFGSRRNDGPHLPRVDTSVLLGKLRGVRGRQRVPKQYSELQPLHSQVCVPHPQHWKPRAESRVRYEPSGLDYQQF